MRQKNQLLRAMAWCAYERFAVQQSYKMLFMYSFVYIAQHWKSISHLMYEKNEFCVTISEINNLKSGRTASVLRYRTIGNKRFVCLESAINMLPDYFVIRRRWGINMCCKSPVAQFLRNPLFVSIMWIVFLLLPNYHIFEHFIVQSFVKFLSKQLTLFAFNTNFFIR